MSSRNLVDVIAALLYLLLPALVDSNTRYIVLFTLTVINPPPMERVIGFAKQSLKAGRHSLMEISIVVSIKPPTFREPSGTR